MLAVERGLSSTPHHRARERDVDRTQKSLWWIVLRVTGVSARLAYVESSPKHHDTARALNHVVADEIRHRERKRYG